MKRILILLLVLLGLACYQPALAALTPPDSSWASIEMPCYTVPVTPTDWIAGPDGDDEEDSITDPVTFELFNPALGQLMQADITVENCIYQTAGFENTATTSTRLKYETGAEIYTTLLDGSTEIISAVGTGLLEIKLPAYDGNKDYGGTSGFSYSLDKCGTDGESVTDQTALAAYIATLPGEKKELPTEAWGSIYYTGSGNTAAQVSTAAGAKVCVKYYYIPNLKIDGSKINDCTEAGIEGWMITLKKDGDDVASTTTGADGSYSFTSLPPGTYQVCETLQDGWTAVGDACKTVTLTDADVSGVDFRNKPDITINCPPPVTIECTDSLDPAVNPNLGTATATVTGGTARVTYIDSLPSGACPATITRTWTATYGTCTESCEQIISIDDTFAPVLPELPAGGSLGCNPIPPSCTEGLKATDSCDGEVPVVCTPGQITGEGCDKSQVFTYSATDACGNTASDTVTYTWKEDNTAPVLSGTPTDNPTVQCYAEVPDAAIVTAEDGCDGAVDVHLDETETNSGSSCSNVITRTWTATDGCGNLVTYTQTITVNDNTPPVITATGTGGELGCNPTAEEIEAALGGATVSDNCDDSLAATVSTAEVVVDGCSRSQTRTFSATDACGNAADSVSVTATWTEDTEKPVITATGTGGELGCNPTAEEIEAALGGATVSDNLR